MSRFVKNEKGYEKATMLYNPERHFQINSNQWNLDKVLSFADKILYQIAAAYSVDNLWPVHPLDREKDSTPILMMYFGVSGVVWGLLKSGLKLQIDPAEILLDCARRAPEDPCSYFFGETGIRLALQSVSPSSENLSKLNSCLELLNKSKTNEIMAGAPGGLLVNQFLWELTQHHLYQTRARDLIAQLLESWQTEESLKLPIWTQDYGSPEMYLGAAHGAVGNIFALLRSTFLKDEERQIVKKKAVSLLKGTVLESSSEANWPTSLHYTGKVPLLHWCHGAPGVLMSLSTLLPSGEDPQFDDILIKAGNLVWKAGGLKKGASLCHGTAGSGAALLKLYERTNDDIWLDRARALAMATIEQIEEHKKLYGRYRYSLWTGDVGAALFLKSCEVGRFRTPMLDVI